MVAGWNPLFFLKHWFHILHFPNSTGLFTKPTCRHYTKYRFSPDIASTGSSVTCSRFSKFIGAWLSGGHRVERNSNMTSTSVIVTWRLRHGVPVKVRCFLSLWCDIVLMTWTCFHYTDFGIIELNNGNIEHIIETNMGEYIELIIHPYKFQWYLNPMEINMGECILIICYSWCKVTFLLYVYKVLVICLKEGRGKHPRAWTSAQEVFGHS